MYCRTAYLQLLTQCNSDLHSVSRSQHYPYMDGIDPVLLQALGTLQNTGLLPSAECLLPGMAASAASLRELDLGTSWGNRWSKMTDGSLENDSLILINLFYLCREHSVIVRRVACSSCSPGGGWYSIFTHHP